MNTAVRITKRIMDLLAGSVGLVVSTPALLAIAAAIKLTSPGPIFYRQRRAGMMNGEDGSFGEFWVYKFRTMVPDAEAMTGVVLASKDDPRVTPVGAVLRRTRLDELPQLLNVLKGEMSLVGPRPERPELIRNLALAIPFFEERMRLIKPGITGLAQISLSYTGRLQEDSAMARLKDTLVNPFRLEGTEDCTADDMRTKMLYDLAYSAYMENFASFLLADLSIVLKTPLVMFFAQTGR